MSFTFIFGGYSAFLMAKFESTYACIFLHSFCNFLGVPNFSNYHRLNNYQKKGKINSSK